MKNLPLFLFGGLIVLLLFSGCVTNPNGNGNGTNNPPGGNGNGSAAGWYSYAPVQANTNPWQVLGNPNVNEQTEDEQVTAWLAHEGITATEFGFIPHDEIVCEALNCPRGDYLVVQPTNSTSAQKLAAMGFTTYATPFVYVTPGMDVNPTIVHLVNASSQSIFYGGCNEFIPEKISVDGMKDAQPPKVCVWEGLPSELAAGQSITFAWNPTQNAMYDVVVGYGVGCDKTKPLSQSNCTSEATLTSVPFSVTNVGAGEKIAMRYEVKQCQSNPWEAGLATDATDAERLAAFSAWASGEGLTVQQARSIPAQVGAYVCTACSCGTGEKLEIVIPGNQITAAEAVGFTYYGTYAALSNTPDFAGAAWYVYTPYQCYSNLWNTTDDPIHSVEKDIRKLTEYLDGKGVKVVYTGFVRGVTLSQQCTKKSTDKYGVAVLDDESKDILASLQFVPAGKQQLELFTSTSDETPTTLLYRTKFCATPPWGTPDLSAGSEKEVSERVTQWLSENGYPSLAPPSIHTIPISSTGTCDTDSGLGVVIDVPAWTVAHLSAVGFMVPSTLFDVEGSQIYPAVNG